MLIRLLFLVSFLILGAQADEYARGEAIFQKHCSSCHPGHIPVDRIKKNFFEMNNTLLQLKAPSVNMLAYAIMDGPKKVGDPTDPEMRQAEIEEYLKEYLSHPDLDESICDPTVMKHYEKKPALKTPLSDEEYAALARYFMEYKSRHKARSPKAAKVRKLSDFANEESILQEARRQDKRIIIEAESEFCHYCKEMKKEVIDDPEVSRALQKDYILVTVDVGKTKLPFDLQKSYRHITPSFFFLDSDGKLLNHYPGSWKKHDFLQILKENRMEKGEQ